MFELKEMAAALQKQENRLTAVEKRTEKNELNKTKLPYYNCSKKCHFKREGIRRRAAGPPVGMVAIKGQNGAYVPGSLLTREVEWLVDIGYYVTLSLANVFNSFAVHDRPKVKWSQQELNQHNDTPQEVLGEAVLTSKIEQQK